MPASPKPEGSKLGVFVTAAQKRALIDLAHSNGQSLQSLLTELINNAIAKSQKAC